MRKDEITRVAYVALAVLGGLLALWALSHIFRPGEPNVELARTVREAMELAREVQHGADAARRTSSALRVIALAAGVAVPFIAVYLIYHLRERSELGPGEVFRMLEKDRLLGSQQHEVRHLPQYRPRLLQDRDEPPAGQKED